MRDKKQTIEYFSMQLSRLEKVIAERESEEVRNRVSAEGLSFYQIGQASYFKKILSVSYVLGAKKKDLFNYFKKSFHYFSQSYDEGAGIANIIDYLSLAVLFDEHKSEFIDDINLLLEKYSDLADNDLVQTDDFISILFHYLLTSEVRPFNAYYEYLNMIGDDFESVKKAQGFWYYTHSDAPWYNSHKYDNRGYVGYWSFDTAALCKMRGILDERLKELDYFPYDLLVQQ